MKADEGARSNGLQGCLLIPEQAEDFISHARRRGAATFTLEVQAEGERMPLQHLPPLVVQLAAGGGTPPLLGRGEETRC